MSKINIEFDTQSKVLDAKMDGKKISNLANIIFYCGEDKDGQPIGNIELTTSEYDDEQKVFKMTRVSAEDSGELIIKEKSFNEEIAELLFSR
jgi:hypothetical protein